MSDAPLPALGELARKATECSALLARYRASTDMSHAATDAEWDECRDALEEFHRFCTPDRVDAIRLRGCTGLFPSPGRGAV